MRLLNSFIKCFKKIHGLGLIFIIFCTCLTGLNACQFLATDFRDRQIPGQEAVYGLNQKTGTSGRALVSDKYFKSLIVEIQAIEGFTPSEDAINRLQRFLESHLKKPHGIQIVLDSPIPSPTSPSSHRYTLNDIRRIENENRHYFTERDRVAVYILFADGGAADDAGASKVLGQAHRNTSIVIYENTLRQLAQAQGGNLWLMEATLMTHEFGHLMGLVNSGIKPQTPQHEDAQHPAHCTQPSCLMHYTIESPETLSILRDHTPDLDPDCEFDLKAIEGESY